LRRKPLLSRSCQENSRVPAIAPDPSNRNGHPARGTEACRRQARWHREAACSRESSLRHIGGPVLTRREIPNRAFATAKGVQCRSLPAGSPDSACRTGHGGYRSVQSAAKSIAAVRAA
jgi:hypothetical protein